MIADEIYSHVLPAVRLVLQDFDGAVGPAGLEERVHAALWSHVTHAVRELRPAGTPSAPEAKRDARSKVWQTVIRFWHLSPIGQEQIAETEPELMTGTGSLPLLVAQYTSEVHDNLPLPPELAEDALKEKLPQLRNNLGRQGSASLRIAYEVGGESYLCQVDVKRPGE